MAWSCSLREAGGLDVSGDLLHQRCDGFGFGAREARDLGEDLDGAGQEIAPRFKARVGQAQLPCTTIIGVAFAGDEALGFETVGNRGQRGGETGCTTRR